MKVEIVGASACAETGSCPSGQAPSGLDATRCDPARKDFSLFDLKMPTPEELYTICRAKYERVKPYMIDQWPASVAALSFPTKLVAVDAADMSSLWQEDETTIPAALAIAERLDAEMGWDSYFVRLNSRSPKDVVDLPITCSGKQAVSWIMSSERCCDDVNVAFNAKAPVFICLRKPRWMHHDEEFRCFAKDGRVLGLSRYFYNEEPKTVLRPADELLSAATAFYERHLAEHYPTVVFDLYAPGTRDELLIELNPYGMSDPCFFVTYEEVEKGGVRLASVDTHAERCDVKQAQPARVGSAVPEGQTPSTSSSRTNSGQSS